MKDFNHFVVSPKKILINAYTLDEKSKTWWNGYTFSSPLKELMQNQTLRIWRKQADTDFYVGCSNVTLLEAKKKNDSGKSQDERKNWGTSPKVIILNDGKFYYYTTHKNNQPFNDCIFTSTRLKMTVSLLKAN